MLSVVLATANHGKIREFQRLLSDVPVSLIPLDQLGIESPVESGSTFVDNARIKALHAVTASGMPALADDSGLAVDALDGRPGVYSARFAGIDGDSVANRARLLQELASVPDGDRSASFTSVLVLAALEDGVPQVIARAEGSVTGTILAAPRGSNGFGYDPLFFVPAVGQTFAEMTDELKSHHSHRARAVRHLQPELLAFAQRHRAGA